MNLTDTQVPETQQDTFLSLNHLTTERRKRRKGRELRNRQQKRKLTVARQAPKTSHQSQINDYTTVRPGDSDRGHRIGDKPRPGDIRMFLQNPNGVKSRKEYHEENRALRQIRDWNVDVIALPETNRNWRHRYTNDQWRQQV